MDRGQGQRDRLGRNVPESQERAENDCEINRAFEKAALFFFRADDQRVGRFEFLCGVDLVFHRVDPVDDHPYCKARATVLELVIRN